MRITLGGLLLVAVSLGTAGPSMAQRERGPRGARITLERHDRSTVTGELLAVGRDSVWLLVGREMRLQAMGELQRVTVRRPGLGPADVLVWSAVGGVGTGAALTGACSSVAEECGGVFVASVLLWGLVGGIAAGTTKSPDRLLPPDSAALVPYARFPQGLPPNFPPGAPVSASIPGPRPNR